MDVLLVYVGLVSLLIILAYPIASYWIGHAWLKDTHWDAAFTRLGEEICDAKSLSGTDLPPAWDRRFRAALHTQATVPRFVRPSDDNLVHAVAILTGGRAGPASRAHALRRIDGLLRRALSQQIADMDSLPYDEEFGRKWFAARWRKDRFIAALSRRDFTHRWLRFTLTQVGVVSSGALFIGAFIGLGWWVLTAFLSGPSSTPPTDWTPVAGAVVTLLTVVAVAAVLVWRLSRAFFTLLPRPATWSSRAVLGFASFLLLAWTLQLTFGFIRFDPQDWMESNASPTRVGGFLFLLAMMTASSVACLLFAQRPRNRSGVTKSWSSRLVAGAGAMFFGLYAFIVGLSFTGRSLALPESVTVIYLIVVLAALTLIVAALVCYVHELFATWRVLEDEGVSIRRLGFREWQVWVGLLWLVVPCIALSWLTKAHAANPLDMSTGEVVLTLVGLMSLPWLLIIGILGSVFGFRVVSARDAKVVERHHATSPRRLVSEDEMGHFVMVSWPLGSHVFGRSAYFLQSKEDEDEYVPGVPPEVSGAELRMPLADWGRSYLERHGVGEPVTTVAHDDDKGDDSSRPLPASRLLSWLRDGLRLLRDISERRTP